MTPNPQAYLPAFARYFHLHIPAIFLVSTKMRMHCISLQNNGMNDTMGWAYLFYFFFKKKVNMACDLSSFAQMLNRFGSIQMVGVWERKSPVA